MSDDAPPRHPAEFHALCRQAIDGFHALAEADLHQRGRLIPALREMLARIDREIDERDIREPGFAREQGLLGDAASALQSIDMDRGGPHVARYVERAIADIRRVAG